MTHRAKTAPDRPVSLAYLRAGTTLSRNHPAGTDPSHGIPPLRCTEVAILNRRITHACLVAVLGGLSLGFYAGCADVVTYSNDARRDGLKNMKDGNTVDAAGS